MSSCAALSAKVGDGRNAGLIKVNIGDATRGAALRLQTKEMEITNADVREFLIRKDPGRTELIASVD